jgi:hypothetical protein
VRLPRGAQTVDNFKQKAQCISDQFGTYTIHGDKKVNGELTLGEDIGTLLAVLVQKLALLVRKALLALLVRRGRHRYSLYLLY